MNNKKYIENWLKILGEGYKKEFRLYHYGNYSIVEMDPSNGGIKHTLVSGQLKELSKFVEGWVNVYHIYH